MAIRTYGKSELAMLYFPDSQPHTAVNHLMAWIRRCGPLNEELKSQHYVRTAKCFTPRQVETPGRTVRKDRKHHLSHANVY